MSDQVYFPGFDLRSISTKRTASIVISKNEIPYNYRNRRKAGKNNNNESNAGGNHNPNPNPNANEYEYPNEENDNENTNTNENVHANTENHNNNNNNIRPDTGTAFSLTQEFVETHNKLNKNKKQSHAEHGGGGGGAGAMFSMQSGCSITTQQSQFFHPKNYYNLNDFHNVKSWMSSAATVDEMEKLPNMDELHNYDKHKQLGTGTDAHVYEVVDRRDKSHVAMKLTKRKSGRYRTEIHLLHQLRTCPFIVKLLKVLEDENVYVLILEQAPMTLEALLHERCTDTPMQERVGKEIMLDVLRGIRAIHTLGFVHKDLKPENVLIFADRIQRKLRAKIADFGFATRSRPPQQFFNDNSDLAMPKHTLTEFVERVGDKCGTPGFWAPELVAGMVQLKQGFKMDVFSAGVTLYRMLCNEMPFGLFETWDIKVNADDGSKKLSKMKPNFQVVSWLRTTSKTKTTTTTNADNEQEVKPKIDYLRKLAPTSLSTPVLALLRGMLRIRPHRRFSVDECLSSKWLATKIEPTEEE